MANKKQENKIAKYIKNNSRLLIAIAIIIVGSYFLFSRNPQTATPKETKQIKVLDAISSVEVNKEFSFPLRDAEGLEVSSVIYTIEKAELRNEIIVNGKRLGSIEGRTLLVLNIKVKNEFDKKIDISTRDYVRLSVNGNKDDWLAADIHNDPVSVQAISTKLTRIAFPINTDDRDLVLRIGEIQGEKEELPLNINY